MSSTFLVTPIPVPQTPADFRSLAPAFANTAMFPDDSVAFWLTAAGMLLTDRWCSTLGLAVVLFVEHNLALEAMASQGGADGIPGLNRGVISSESVKSVSVSYDTGAGTEKDAGHWNLTTYGTRLKRMMNLYGAGPIQLNIGTYAPGGFFAMGAYTGPSFGPGWWS